MAKDKRTGKKVYVAQYTGVVASFLSLHTHPCFILASSSRLRALKKILTTPNTGDQPQHSPTSSVVKDYGIPVTTLREIKYLKQVDHDNCVDLIEIAFEKGK